MNRKPFEPVALLQVAAAFAAGALAAYWIGSALLRRRDDAAPPDEGQLRERVRQRIADLVSYPRAIEVTVDGGLVRLSGHVLASELDRLLSQLTQVPRVYKVYNALVPLDDPGRFEQLVNGALRDSGPEPAP